MQEMRVQSLGQENPLEEEMATHSSILALEIPWTEEPGRLQSMGPKRVWLHLATEHTNTYSKQCDTIGGFEAQTVKFFSELC